MDGQQPVGHRSLPHTADLRIEAWAPSRERCAAEAVAAMVDSFAGMRDTQPAATVEFRVDPGSDEDMLVGILEQVIFLMDTADQLPADAEVAVSANGGLVVRLRMVGTDRVERVGAVPKAVSLHDLRFAAGEQGWACGVTLDV